MDYEKLHKETLQGLQKLVAEGKITEDVAKQICHDFVAESEDERIRKALVKLVKKASEGYENIEYGVSVQDAIAWLEKQKYEYEIFEPIESTLEYKEGFKAGVESVKPTEWSEEDKTIIDTAIYWLERKLEADKARDISTRACPLSMKETIKRLKSLRPAWKPSEEQIEALKNVAFGSYQNGDGPILRKLYNDIEKL